MGVFGDIAVILGGEEILAEGGDAGGGGCEEGGDTGSPGRHGGRCSRSTAIIRLLGLCAVQRVLRVLL